MFDLEKLKDPNVLETFQAMIGRKCADLVEIRKKYFEEGSVHSLFQNVIPEISFDFLWEIGVVFKSELR